MMDEATARRYEDDQERLQEFAERVEELLGADDVLTGILLAVEYVTGTAVPLAHLWTTGREGNATPAPVTRWLATHAPEVPEDVRGRLDDALSERVHDLLYEG